MLWLLTPAGAFEFYKEGFSRSLPAGSGTVPILHQQNGTVPLNRTEALWRLHATPQLQPSLKPTPWLVKGVCLAGDPYHGHEQPTQQDDTGLP